MGNVTWYITCSKCEHVQGYPTKKERDTAYKTHLNTHERGEIK